MPQVKPILVVVFILTPLWLFQFSGAIAAPKQQGQDIASITSPGSNAVVQGVVEIVGSADHPAFQFYVIEVSPEPVTGGQWQIAGEIGETPVLNGVLTAWNTAAVPDGSYTLRLRVVRLDGNYTEAFSQQVVVANTQPLPTDTPTPLSEEEQQQQGDSPPTPTPTDLPPTPTILIEQPVVETPTPRPAATSTPLENPEENQSFMPEISGFSISPLRSACLYGGGLMLIIFIFFGFLSALRIFFKGFIESTRKK